MTGDTLRQATAVPNRQSLADPRKPCKKGYYKIMAFIDKGKDYHWYKQNGSLLYRVSDGETRQSIARDLGVPATSVVCPTDQLKLGDLVNKLGCSTGHAWCLRLWWFILLLCCL